MTALRREVLEETGLRVTPGDLIAEIEEYAYADELGHFIKAGRYYQAQILDITGPPQEAGHRLLWMSYAEAQAHLIHEGQRWVLSQV